MFDRLVKKFQTGDAFLLPIAKHNISEVLVSKRLGPTFAIVCPICSATGNPLLLEMNHITN